MPLRTRIQSKGVEVVALPNVVEQKNDQANSAAEARKRGGTLVLTEERLHQLLTDPEFIRKMEGTSAYKENDFVSFWTEIEGTERETGYYRIMPAGTQGKGRFQFVSDDYNEALKKVPNEELAYFSKGSNYLWVDVRRSGLGCRRVGVGGVGRLEGAASVVVVEQAHVPNAHGGETSLEDALRFDPADARESLAQHIEAGLGGPSAVSTALRSGNVKFRLMVADALRNMRETGSIER